VVATGGADAKVNLWKIGKPSCLLSVQAAKSAVECVAFDPEENVVAAGAYSGSIRLFALNKGGQVRCRLAGHRTACLAAEFHPLGNVLVSGGVDSNVKVWDIRNKNCARTFMGHEGDVTCVKFSPDGRWAASGSADRTVKLWDLQAGKMIHEFASHRGAISSLAFHPDERWLATGSQDGTVKYWDLETFRSAGCTPTERGVAIQKMVFVPDREEGRDESKTHQRLDLVCATNDGVRVWNWHPCRCVASEQLDWGPLADAHVTRDRHGDDQLEEEEEEEGSVYEDDFETVVSPGRVAQKPDAGKPSEDERDYRDEDDPKPDESKRGKSRKSRQQAPQIVKASTSRKSERKPPVPRFATKPVPPPQEEKMGVATPQVIHNLHKARKDVPLDLSISEFMGGGRLSTPGETEALGVVEHGIGRSTQHQLRQVAPAVSRTIRSGAQVDVAEQVLRGHSKYVQVLQERLDETQHVMDLWKDGRQVLALEHLEGVGNFNISFDFVRQVNFRNGQSASLDNCAAVLPILTGLVASQFESHIKLGLGTAKYFFDQFGAMVQSVLQQNASAKANSVRQPVDVSREERVLKCKRCAAGFRGILHVLQGLVAGETLKDMARTRAEAENLMHKLMKEKFLP
ncbi:Katanin p80 WD40 repeat-containing subunit B1 (Katanin p80 subunit B1) (p80 katanin), partial [Durusdinium trenchii]